MQADALSEVLRTIRLRGAMFFRLELRAPYSVCALDAEDVKRAYAPECSDILPFHMVTRGSICFESKGHAPMILGPGDIIVLPTGAGHSFSDAPGRPATHVNTLSEDIHGDPPTLHHGGHGEPASAVCGFFHCQGRLFNPLLQALPPVLVVPGGGSRSPWLAATIERTFTKSLEDTLGGSVLVERLTELLFLEVLQHHLEHTTKAGWLSALADPVVGTALRHLHATPAEAWTVESLARRAGASRTVFAEQFTALVGQSPMHYLTAWRMELAAQRLADSRDSILQIALEVGYESEAAFSRAFKRRAGLPPSRWRKREVASGAAQREA